MKRISLFTVRALALVFFLLLLACAEEPLGGSDNTGDGYTITLHLAATVSPNYYTEAVVQPSTPGSETGEGGFDCEIVSSDADSVVFSLATKAPATLKNAYALLFTSGGAFNGRAAIGTITAGSALDITFTNVVTTTAANCRLVIVANDNAAVTSYASSGGTGGFDGFSGTYADFQKLTLTSAIAIDTDVPYAGYATFDLSNGTNDTDISVPIYRTLAKITFKNTFAITSGPERSSITLYNAGERRFATPNSDAYDGSGSTNTTTFVATTTGKNDDTNVWYVGENIRPAGSGISSGSDRNSSKAPANACYIRIESGTQPITGNTNPAIGQEYIQPGSRSFTYDIYLGKSSDISDFSVRRNTNYTFTTTVSGTLAKQEELSLSDSRVKLTKIGGESAGLVIGRFGGATDYTTINYTAQYITGTYTRLLLLEPNTSRTTAADTVIKAWGVEASKNYQTQNRKIWDRTHAYSVTTDGTIGGMRTTADGLYAYCYELTLGNVPKGTWYVPAQAQLQLIWAVYGGMKEGNFKDYSAFNADYYWSSTEESGKNARYVYFNDGTAYYDRSKKLEFFARCVRDSPAAASPNQNVIEVNQYPVIDLSELSPLGCILTSAEARNRRTQMNTQTPSNTEYLPIGVGISGHNGTWNSKMSAKFQIMRADHTASALLWAEAYNQCKQYNGEGGTAGQWRLPTQRELTVIDVLHPQFQGKGSIDKLSSSYWCSTEGDSKTISYYLHMSTGILPSSNKGNYHKLRCVRDLE